MIYISKISFFIEKLLIIYNEKEVFEILQIDFNSKAYFLKDDDILSIIGFLGGSSLGLFCFTLAARVGLYAVIPAVGWSFAGLTLAASGIAFVKDKIGGWTYEGCVPNVIESLMEGLKNKKTSFLDKIRNELKTVLDDIIFKFQIKLLDYSEEIKEFQKKFEEKRKKFYDVLLLEKQLKQSEIIERFVWSDLDNIGLTDDGSSSFRDLLISKLRN